MLRRPDSKCSVPSRAVEALRRDQQEAHLQQAAAELDSGQHGSIPKAAAANNVPEATLRHQRAGCRPKKDAQIDLQRLPPTTETALVDCIKHCACSGFPLTPAALLDYANTMTRSVPRRSLPAEPSRNWLQSFLIQHPSIRMHWSRCLNNSCLKGATEDAIRQWYVSLGEIMRNFRIALTNIFNMDETGFMFGQAGSERVVVPSSDPASRFKAQPGTRESATVIECIGSGGQVLPPLIITKGVRHTVGEHRRMEGVPASWHFTKSSNGWTNNELAVNWLKTIFNPSARLST